MKLWGESRGLGARGEEGKARGEEGKVLFMVEAGLGKCIGPPLPFPSQCHLYPGLVNSREGM